MASNISVAITVDNKQYIANINAADNATKKFATDTEKNLGKVGGSFDVLSKRVLGLRGVLAGLAFGAVGKSALQMADQLQDLSNSTGIAVSTLLEFRNALAVTGGEAEQMPTAINKLLQSVDEAANGSIKAQNSFAKLGINLQELGSLSEQDLLAETLKGIAALPSKTEQAAAMMDKFGKSFKMVDPQELLDKLTATAGSGERYAASIKRAAELNDQLTTAQNNLKLAFLEAFSPAISALSELSNNIGNTTSSMSGLITTVKVLGIALGAALGAEIGVYLTRMIGHLLRATQVMGLFGTASFAATSTLMNGIRGVMVSFGVIGIAILAASLLFENFGKEVKQVMLFVGEYALKAAALLGSAFSRAFMIPIMAINALSKALGLGIKIPEDLGEPLRKLAEDARMARRELDVFSGRSSAEFAATDERRSDIGSINARKKAGTGTGSRPIDTTATDNALKAIRDISAEYEKQRALTLNKLDLETSLIGKTQEEKQLLEAQNQLAQDFLNVQDQLIKKRDSLSKEDKEQGVQAAAINEQIKKNALAYDGQLTALNKTVAANQHALMLEKNRLQEIKNIFELMEQTAKAQEEIAGFASTQDAARISAFEQVKAQKEGFDLLMRREDLERGILNLREQDKTAALQLFDLENDRKKQLEDIRKMEALPFEGVGGMKQRLQEVNDLYDARLVRIKETQARTTEEQNSFSFGWAQATEKYRNSITTNAEYASKQMQNFTKGIEDAFVKFVQTGKLSFKDLANSMIADFARIQAQKLLAGAFGGGGGGGFFGSLFGRMFGGITGGGGGGAMANGGQVQGNTPYLIGERGPEMFVPQNAGKIIPNHALGGGGAGQSQVINNAVTYSIQAVDASSFRTLLARDPEFLHNVSEQGRRSMPIRSRR